MQRNLAKSLKRLKTISFYGINQIIAPLTQIVISIIVIRFHSIELWGIYIELLIWINFLLLFVSFGNRDYLLKKFSANPANLFQLWLTNLNARSLLLLISICAVFFFAVDLKIQVLLVIWLFAGFFNNACQVLILFRRDFKVATLTETISNLLLITTIFLLIDLIDLYLLIKIIVIFSVLKSVSYFMYYFKYLKNLKYNFDFTNLAYSFSFFVPILAGTIRSKIDIYYAAIYFDSFELASYQVFIGFLGLAPLAGTFVLNPFLKNFFRLNKKSMLKIQNKAIIFGFAVSLFLAIGFNYFINLFYNIELPKVYYFLGFLFMLPVFLHVLLINEFYKFSRQRVVANIASFVLLLQLIIGYFLISEFGMQGALYIKTGGMWLILILLLSYRKIKIA